MCCLSSLLPCLESNRSPNLSTLWKVWESSRVPCFSFKVIALPISFSRLLQQPVLDIILSWVLRFGISQQPYTRVLCVTPTDSWPCEGQSIPNPNLFWDFVLLKHPMSLLTEEWNLIIIIENHTYFIVNILTTWAAYWICSIWIGNLPNLGYKMIRRLQTSCVRHELIRALVYWGFFS